MSFLDLAGEGGPKPTFLDLAGSGAKGKRASKPAVDSSGSFTTNDPVEMRRQIVASGDTGLLQNFDQQFQVGAGRGIMPASAYAPPSASGPVDRNGIPVRPGANVTPSGNTMPPSWWDRTRATGEAAANTVAGAVGGGAGAIYGGLEAIGENVGSLASGNTPQMDVGKQAALRAQQFTPELPKALQTPLGREYTADVGDALQTHGGSIVAIGPELGALGTILKSGARYDATMVGGAASRGREAVMGPAAEVPVRVDPTMTGPAPAPLPRYKLVDGKPIPVEAPTVPAEAPPAAVAPLPLSAASPELQQKVAAKQSAGEPVNQVVLARHVAADTLPVPVKLTAGQATMDPTLISEEMNGRGKSQPTVSPAFYNAQGKALVQNGAAILEAAAPDVTATNAVQHGQALVDAYKSMDAPVRADIRAKYQALADANGGDLPVKGQDFVAAADAALAKQMKGRYVPPEIQADLDAIRAGGPMTFENFENMRTNLAAEGRKAERAGDGNRAAAISIVRDSLESLPMTDEAAGLKPLADAARSAARTRFDRIKADPAYRAAVNDAADLGDASPLAETFANTYVVKGKRANVIQMQQNLGNDPAAKQTIASAAINHLLKQAGADETTGNFSQSGYNRALANDIGPKADLLFEPKTAAHVQALGDTAKLTQAQPRGAYVNNSNTLVGAMGEFAKAGLEGAVNVKAGGVPVGTWVRKGFQARSAAKAAKASVETGAGITRLGDVGK